MTTQIELKLRNYPGQYIGDSELSALLEGSDYSRYGQVKRALAAGALLRVRRGLYSIPRGLAGLHHAHPFELAAKIYGPSYVSLESALSYHNLIPEAVYTITSVTPKRTTKFNTPLGLFTYQHLPSENFFVEVERVEEERRLNKTIYFMATPWKAITDFVFCYKKDWRDIDPLINSLRIEPESLPILDEKTLISLENYYKSSRVTKFLQGVSKELKK